MFGVISNIVCTRGCLTANEIIGTTIMQCAAYSPSSLDDWSYGTHSFDYVFQILKNISFSFSGSSWASLVVGGSSATWDINLTIDTTNQTYTGVVNSSPETLMAPLIVIRQGFSFGIYIPYTDKDVTNTIRCRWSLSVSECGG